MKLLVISAAFPPAPVGEADHAMHLCDHLAQRGLEVHVLTTKRPVEAIRHQFTVHAIMPHWLWADLPRLAKVLRQSSPDAVLLMYTARDYDYNHMITFAPTFVKALLPRARFVTQFETDLFAPQGSVLGRVTRRVLALCAGSTRIDHVFGTLLSKSDRIIVLSERHLVTLSSQFPHLNGKVMVVPPPPLLRIAGDDGGAARQRGRHLLGVGPDEFLLAYYGYLYEEKGIDTLLRAFQILNRHRSNVRLVIIGGGGSENQKLSYASKVRQLATQLRIADKIIWTGEYAHDSDDASLYLRAADAGVLPFNHGVTLNRSSVAAAAAHGLPIVTTRGSVLESPFVDGENVLLCPPFDPASVSRALETVLDSPELRQRLSCGAIELFRQVFSWDRILGLTMSALEGTESRLHRDKDTSPILAQ